MLRLIIVFLFSFAGILSQFSLTPTRADAARHKSLDQARCFRRLIWGTQRTGTLGPANLDIAADPRD